MSPAYTVINGCKGGVILIAFKKPLSAGEEEACIRQTAAGDAQARSRLIEHNMRLVAHIARKYTQTAREPDDLISIGTVGLIKAIDTYNYKKGNRLATYAARCIENAILSQMRLWFQINPPKAEKNQSGVFWHRFPRMFTSFVLLWMAM